MVKRVGVESRMIADCDNPLKPFVAVLTNGEECYVAAYDIQNVPELVHNCELIEDEVTIDKVVPGDESKWKAADFHDDQVGNISLWEAFEKCSSQDVFGTTWWG